VTPRALIATQDALRVALAPKGTQTITSGIKRPYRATLSVVFVPVGRRPPSIQWSGPSSADSGHRRGRISTANPSRRHRGTRGPLKRGQSPLPLRVGGSGKCVTGLLRRPDYQMKGPPSFCWTGAPMMP